MRIQTLELLGGTPGVQHHLQVLHFGTPGRGPKATVQASLHADEVPAMLVAQALRRRLETLEADGLLLGHVQLVPMANPIGLAQNLLGHPVGRFDLRDGGNFNRAHADLGAGVAAAVEGRLGGDAAANVAVVRAALCEAALALPASNPTLDLKRQLLALAIDSDVVLDLHCDGEAVMHLYALTPQRAAAEELGALLGAEAVLLAEESGDGPFDEACSRPWLQLQQRLPAHPLPLACFAATVELRGECDTDHALAEQDAAALVEFLCRRGVVGGPAAPLPAPRCRSTPLVHSEPLTAPSAGVVVFHVAPGQRVAAGDCIADLVSPDDGALTPVRAQSAGMFYARSGRRWAFAGQRLGKIAGTTFQRSGKLLSP